MTALRVVPLTRDEANALVRAWHRHHRPVVGYRFALGVVDRAGEIHAAAIVGRPVGRGVPWRRVAEVTRLVTDRTPHAASMLYGACARACRAMGYDRVQTYTLAEEAGTSLLAAGWEREATVPGRAWRRSDGSPRTTDQPGAKVRWGRSLNDPAPEVLPPPGTDAPQLDLWADPLDKPGRGAHDGTDGPGATGQQQR